MTEEKQKDSGRTKRVRLSSELSVLAFQQRICPKCALPVIPGLEKCPRDGTSLKQHESGPHQPVPVPTQQSEILQMSDRYDHLGSLGSGGMSVVYKARDKNLDRVVAIKQLISAVSSEKMVLRFQREACAYAALKHPNIVNVFDFGFDEENRPFLVMDFLEGQTFDEVIAAKGRISIPETLEIFIQILDGLSHAHQKGIIHRDLKPANVMIQRIGKTDRVQVKLMDFGIAKVKVKDPQAAWQTQTGQVMGSPLYMSPEQSSDSSHVDGRSDIYAVGCMLFEALTGKPPFRGETMMETVTMHRSATPPKMTDLMIAGGVGTVEPLKAEFDFDMEAIVYAAIEKDPDDRYQSAADMRADLLCVQENLNKLSQGDGTKPNTISKHSMTRLVASASVAALLLGVGGALTYAHFTQSAKKIESPPTEEKGDSNLLFNIREFDRWTDADRVKHSLPPEIPLSSINPAGAVRSLVVGQYILAKVSKQEDSALLQQYQHRLDGIERLKNLKSLLIWNLHVTPQNVQAISTINRIARVAVFDTTVPHDIVSVLKTLQKLETLELKMCELTPEDIVDLPKMPFLHKLVLDDNKIGRGDGFAPLGKCGGLLYLSVNNTQITDESVKYLTSLHYLKQLLMERAEISAEGCKQLTKLPNLTSLTLGFSTIDDRGLKELANAKQLQSLDLQGCPNITDNGAQYICQLKNLSNLDLAGTKVTERGIGEIRKSLPLLKQFKYSSQFEEIDQVFTDTSKLGEKK